VALIKRYANRKLYDSTGGRYVTLEEIGGLVRAGEDVRVVDHASGRDLTSLVLLQVVLSEEKRFGEMLPRAVLTHLLRAGEERMDVLRERMLAAFDPERHLEEELRRRIERLVARGEIASENAGRLLEQLLRHEEASTFDAPKGDIPAAAQAGNARTLAELQAQLETLERQLADIQAGADGPLDSR
jgi:polyhydroxyalkanoate synthesis repressor PhaR